MISGKSKVCGVMAYPVEHSMSPLMHNYYSEKTGTDLVYVPFKVEPGRVEEAVKGAYALNFTGMNVTVPHKQEVMKYLVDIDEDAKAIGAVNTLVRTDGGYKGYNTDAAGLKRAMTEAGIEIRDRTCILFGAGGAARAAACVLAKEGASVIYVLNRSLEKAEALSEIVNERFGRRVMLPMALDDYGKLECSSCLAVQTTSVGMHPNVDHAPVEDAEFYKKIDTAVDIVYTPMETKFMKYVRAAGGKAVGGLDMLIYQGVIAYELWNPETVFTREMIDGASADAGRTGGCAMKNVILIGFMGAGKTTVGERYAKKHGLPMVDTDWLIEERAGMTISEIFAQKGEDEFRRTETAVLQTLLSDTQEKVISVGGGLPLREENRRLLKQLGTVIYLEVNPDTVLKRLKGDTTRPLLQGGDVTRRVEELIAARGPIYREAAGLIVDVNGRSVGEIVTELEERMGFE